MLYLSFMKTAKRSSKRSRKVTDRSATTDVVTQLECAIRRPEATLIGALVGGLVPWFARTLAHDQLPAAWSAGQTSLAAVMLAVVLGCAVFSAITVYKFGLATFGDTRKALGFTLAIEGVMLVSTGTTSAVALAVLILINALANGSAIALARDATCKRRDADVRRAASRAASRPAARAEQPAPGPSRARKPAAAASPSWHPVATDIVDAEIVSETRLLA